MDYETYNIRAFLREFTDQKLANLQAACEDGRFDIRNCCTCLVAFASDNTIRGYEALRDSRVLSRVAEQEGFAIFHRNGGSISLNANAAVIAVLLPCIADEWTRRAEATETQPEVCESLSSS